MCARRHDEHSAAALDVRLTTNMPKFHGAIGSKLGFTIMNLGKYLDLIHAPHCMVCVMYVVYVM